MISGAEIRPLRETSAASDGDLFEVIDPAVFTNPGIRADG